MNEKESSRKIALFLPSLRGGGAERVMVTLARGFVERGLTVDFVLAKAEGPFIKEVPAAVRVVDLGASRVLFCIPGLVCYLRKERPDAMLSTLNHANIVAILARKLSFVSPLLVVREASAISISAANALTIRGKLIPLLIRAFYRWADVIVANCRELAEELARLISVRPEKIKIIYNPIIPEILARAEEPVEHSWFSPSGPPIILSVGRLTAAKDFPLLVRAFAIVRKKCQAKLVIIGEGEERSKLDNLVSELGLEKDIDFLGFVDNPYKFIKRATLFVLSSKWEGFPNVLVEALALETPVISTNCPTGSTEILENGKYGKLVSVGDEKMLANKIIDVIFGKTEINPDEVKKVIFRKYSFDHIVSQYIKILIKPD